MLTVGLHSTYAEDAVSGTSLTLEAGYVDTLYINGVPRVSEAPFVGAGFVKPNALPLGLDLTGGALLTIPEEDNSESHWNLGVAKTIGFDRQDINQHKNNKYNNGLKIIMMNMYMHIT